MPTTVAPAVSSGPPPQPPRPTSRRLGRIERIGAAVAAISTVAFLGVAAVAHADSQCRDVVEMWTSGEQQVVGTTCDQPAARPTPDNDGPPARHASHPDAIAT